MEPTTALNAICPYFTMFPLDFPMRILNRYGQPGQRVLDPFCGRGTTNFAARLSGLHTVGMDSSPVATAITAAKLATTNARAVMRAAQRILDSVSSATVPTGEFWDLAYHPKVLRTLTRLRAALLADCSSNARRMLRGIILGALHGPKCQGLPSYFSNQCTRTYAPKPRYAVNYWRAHKQKPPHMDVLGLIERRAKRYLEAAIPSCENRSLQGDSRDPAAVAFASRGE